MIFERHANTWNALVRACCRFRNVPSLVVVLFVMSVRCRTKASGAQYNQKEAAERRRVVLSGSTRTSHSVTNEYIDHVVYVYKERLAESAPAVGSASNE